MPITINPNDAIAGFYGATPGFHGFLRAPDGNITTFDPPGSLFTFVADMTPASAITGYYIDASFLEHGYLRTP
jgi:hypothetical protein